MQPVLKVEKVVKRYANHTALDKVSFEVPAQSVFGLLGPNGAGKTSLIRIINQITGPDYGEIYMNGEPLQEAHVGLIGYLPEERGLYKKMKVGEQALYLAQLKGMKKADAKQALQTWFEKFDMTTWWNKKIEELSKGMAQKVQFITTIIHQPKLLILDEPFSGFDPINTNLIKSEILKMRDEGTTVILSTHNMGSVEEICDNIALINNAKVILNGGVKEIRKSHRSNTYDFTFDGNMIGFTNAMWTGCELLDKENLEGETHRATIKLLGQTTLNHILEAVLPHVQIHSVIEQIPSMNDIFIKSVSEKEEAHDG